MAYKKPQPILRFNPLGNVLRALDHLLSINKMSDPFQSCLNCKNWSEEKDLCKKFNSKPPTEIIVYSCGTHYEDDNDIPF